MVFRNISVKQAVKMAGEYKAVLWDIREEEAYQRGHLPMADHVERGCLEERIRNYRIKRPQNVLIILYCDYGNSSMRAARELADKGYENIASMVGGYHAYEGYVEMKKNDLWTMEWKWGK